MDQSPTTPATARSLPPRSEFDEHAYLRLYPDVAAGVDSGAIGSAWQHFSRHGFKEGRQWSARLDSLAGVSREISPHDEMYRGNADHYFDTGESAMQCIDAALIAAHRPRSSITRVLDLPCGAGRVMRFLRQAFPDAELTACDLARPGVEFCAKAFGAVPVFSQVDPAAIPLPGEFDLIWCGSLLTHLSRGNCAAFLQLFRRILRPNGVLVFTMHGRRCETEFVTGKNRCGLDERQSAQLLDEYRRTGFAYVDYADQPGYGISLAQPAFTLANFTQHPGWQLVSYQEAGWDKRQDAIGLQKLRPGAALAASSASAAP